jgi:hypothetical protein
MDRMLPEQTSTDRGVHIHGTSSPHASGGEPWIFKSVESGQELWGKTIRAVTQFCEDVLRTMVSVLSARGFVKSQKPMGGRRFHQFSHEIRSLVTPHMNRAGVHESASPSATFERLGHFRIRLPESAACHEALMGTEVGMAAVHFRLLGAMEGLSPDTAPRVEDRGGFSKSAAEIKGSDGASAVARGLTGQVFVNLEEDLQEATSGLAHANRPS